MKTINYAKRIKNDFFDITKEEASELNNYYIFYNSLNATITASITSTSCNVEMRSENLGLCEALDIIDEYIA
jgi:hypothetical protein